MTDLSPNEIFSFLEKKLPELKGKEIEKLTGQANATSGSGAITEDWLKEKLKTICKNTQKNIGAMEVYSQGEFLQKYFEAITGKEKKITPEIWKKIKQNWWYGPFGLPKGFRAGMIEQFNLGEDLGSQQAGADIVIFYGKDLKKDSNDLIIINAKSKNTVKKTQPPNLISIRKILKNHVEFIKAEVSDKKKQKELFGMRNYWFIGVYSKEKEVQEIHLKDLYKLNVEKITINFTAALQLQRHVKDMDQIQSQTSEQFIKKLATKVLEKWKPFSKKKTKEYEQYVAGLE